MDFFKKNISLQFIFTILISLVGIVSTWSVLNYRVTNIETKQCKYEEKTDKGFDKVNETLLIVITKLSNIEGKLSK